jgi:hypothetical protein
VRFDTATGRHTGPEEKSDLYSITSFDAAAWEVLTFSGSLMLIGAGLIDRGGAYFSKPATCCWTAPKPKSPSFDIGGDGGRSPTTAAVIFGCV